MTTKLLIVFLCIVCGTMVGLFFSRRLKERRDYFKSIVGLADFAENQIRFKASRTAQILEEFKTTNKTKLNEQIDQYLEVIKNNRKTEEFCIKSKLLKPEEREQSSGFFKILGTLPSDIQVSEIGNHKQRLKTSLEKADEAFTKRGAMFVKLGFLAGLALGIILL